MKTHLHFRQHPPKIQPRCDGSLKVSYRRLLLRKTVHILIDPQDLRLFLTRAWNVNCDGILISGYALAAVRLHRLIAGVKPGERIEFANGNTFDLRRANLFRHGRCRAVGLAAPGLYPRYKLVNGKKDTKIVNGIRTFVALPSGKFYREFPFDKCGLNRAALRALEWRVGTLRAHGIKPCADLEACLMRAKRMCTHAEGAGSVKVNGRKRARETAEWLEKEAT